MSAPPDETGRLAQLGESCAWAWQQALEALGREHPKHAAAIVAGLKSGSVRVQVVVESGGGRPSRVLAFAIDGENHACLLASLSVKPFHLN